jgi:hypothetical protein
MPAGIRETKSHAGSKVIGNNAAATLSGHPAGLNHPAVSHLVQIWVLTLELVS